MFGPVSVPEGIHGKCRRWSCNLPTLAQSVRARGAQVDPPLPISCQISSSRLSVGKREAVGRGIQPDKQPAARAPARRGAALIPGLMEPGRRPARPIGIEAHWPCGHLAGKGPPRRGTRRAAEAPLLPAPTCAMRTCSMSDLKGANLRGAHLTAPAWRRLIWSAPTSAGADPTCADPQSGEPGTGAPRECQPLGRLPPLRYTGAFRATPKPGARRVTALTCGARRRTPTSATPGWTARPGGSNANPRGSRHAGSRHAGRCLLAEGEALRRGPARRLAGPGDRTSLRGADLTGARYDADTRWPRGFDPRAHGASLC